ncbi:endonuclease/exonuclease/phosphatase family protein [Litorimonas sp. RW-G-Af-16]|uniref:endonuclease/exonuclease/phosphatase family protein n=1 Tax=Litorimonas sp. RW-G-Af-16 TaxID=3241168 RepID=UPI00390C9384
MVIWDVIWRIWAVAVLLGTAIPFLREQVWWLRAWTYARLQMLVLLSGTAIVHAFHPGLDTLFDQLIFVGLIIGILSCLRDIVPFTKLWWTQTPEAKLSDTNTSIRLMVGNVLMENSEQEAYLSQIKDISPDILFLVETDAAWRSALSELEAEYPHTYMLPLPDFNGMLFYSRYPILNVQERYFIQDHIPSLTIDLDVGHSQALRFYGVHPRPPRPEDDTSDLDAELNLVANEVGHLAGPVIVTGDLNDVGWSSTTKKFLRMSGLLDPRHGRGLFNSYNAKNPIVRWPLDHVFHSKHFSLIDMKRLKACGSDHFPLLINFALNDPKP